MQIFIHRGKSKALDCDCGGDAKTIDPPKSEAQRRAMWAAAEGRSTLGIPKSVGKEFVGKDARIAAADALTPVQYIKHEYASGRIPTVNIDYIAKSYYLCDKDFNILSGIGYDTRQEAEIARSKLLNQGRKNNLANA